MRSPCVHIFPSGCISALRCVLSVTRSALACFSEMVGMSCRVLHLLFNSLVCSVVGLSCGSGSHREGPGDQCFPVWLGRLPPSAGAGTEEEGDGLVQEEARHADSGARHRAAATGTLRTHR